MSNTDKHEGFVTELFSMIAARHEPDQAWADSPYLPILAMPPVRQATVARTVILSWAMVNDISMKRAHGRHNAVEFEGREFGIKFSTMWTGRKFRFQQFKPGSYDHYLCLGLAPDGVRLWVIPDSVFRDDLPGISPQHSRADRWIETELDNEHAWISTYGGTLEAAANLILGLRKIQPESTNEPF